MRPPGRDASEGRAARPQVLDSKGKKALDSRRGVWYPRAGGGSMSNETAKCQYVDKEHGIICEAWYPFQLGEKYCEEHRIIDQQNKDFQLVQQAQHSIHAVNNVTRIGKSGKAFAPDYVDRVNDTVNKWMTFSIPELAEHLQNMDVQLQEIEFQRRTARMAKHRLEEQLTEEERADIRNSPDNIGHRKEPSIRKPKKTKEEKAAQRKEGFPAWAARLGMNTEELMQMDEDEMAARIAKYKASRPTAS